MVGGRAASVLEFPFGKLLFAGENTHAPAHTHPPNYVACDQRFVPSDLLMALRIVHYMAASQSYIWRANLVMHVWESFGMKSIDTHGNGFENRDQRPQMCCGCFFRSQI